MQTTYVLLETLCGDSLPADGLTPAQPCRSAGHRTQEPLVLSAPDSTRGSGVLSGCGMASVVGLKLQGEWLALLSVAVAQP